MSPADNDDEDVDPIEVARELLKRMDPEERALIQDEAERHQISEEYVILQALLGLDLTEFKPLPER